ncbi:MAG: transcriptional regulator TrmB [Candidatus Taylorbacteria bacterium]|nr:transcriptional regulator TrmB [Candidatus Taylorbacteria bacterium]
MIEQILQELGLKEKEVKTYLAVLELGHATPAHIARLTGINRSTTYSIAKELIARGIIVEDVGGKQNYLTALPPEDLKKMIRKEELELQNKKVLIGKAVDALKDITKNTRYSIPKIQFVYEEDIEAFMEKQAPIWSQSILKNDSIWWGFQDPSFVKSYQGWIDWYWKKCAPSKLSLRLLSNESKFEADMSKRGYSNRIIKFWNGEGDFTATTWVTGDYLTLIVTNQKPHYLVQIYDAKLAHNMRELFKGIWEGIK